MLLYLPKLLKTGKGKHYDFLESEDSEEHEDLLNP